MIDSSQWNEPAHPDDILPVGSALVDEGEAGVVKGATPASVRAATMAALGVSPQVNDPGQLELGDAEVNTI